MYSLISLFTCCLEGQVGSLDLAMMDVVTGYFGRIHIATDFLVSVPFVRVLTSLAGEHLIQAASGPTLTSADQFDAGAQCPPGSFDDLWIFGSLDNSFDLEDWSTFSRTSPSGIPAYVEPML
jgi:hypothetical protein